MKVLKGQLRETRYTLPESPGIGPRIIKETTYNSGEVTYMADELGLHRIINLNPTEVAVSLHRKLKRTSF
jgi:cysteine dioxygenase